MAGQPRLTTRRPGPAPPPDRDLVTHAYRAYIVALAIGTIRVIVREVFSL